MGMRGVLPETRRTWSPPSPSPLSFFMDEMQSSEFGSLSFIVMTAYSITHLFMEVCQIISFCEDR